MKNIDAFVCIDKSKVLGIKDVSFLGCMTGCLLTQAPNVYFNCLWCDGSLSCWMACAGVAYTTICAPLCYGVTSSY